MSKNNEVVLRVQSADGTQRVNIRDSSSLRELYELVQKQFSLNDFGFALYKERNYKNELVSSRSQTIKGCSLKHGDMIYMKQLSEPSTSSGGSSSSSSLSNFATPSTSTAVASTSKNSYNTSNNSKQSKEATLPSEDSVDIELYKIEGRIERKRDDKLCRHNSNSKCVHCSPLEPYDENYLKEQKIKHFSFHAFLRKLTSGVDRGKFVALEDLNCKIKTGCRDHPPWPKGICSKCQPSAITLNRQTYRHLDNVMFENPGIVERFLNYWRCTGHQRIGYLYGQYEMHPDVPLGIRAHVAAIYEPPQESGRDFIRLIDDEHENDVEEMAKLLGLRRVGWIFTDLISEDISAGTVKTTRGIKTHFLTAQECILAGNFQNKYPNRCKYASNGYFGSKFGTVCVTGDKTKQVHMEGYAVSAQCMALVRDNCLVPTKDAPELGYVRESTDKQYVPDVYYKEKDVYGNEVQRLARPLPVEYLLVDVPTSTPLIPLYTFPARKDSKDYFPVENRMIDGHIQDFQILSQYLGKSISMNFLEAISDFHLLLYLFKMDMLPMKSEMTTLLEAVRNKDSKAANEWKNKEVWCTLEQLILAHSSDGGMMSNDVEFVPTDESEQADWTCSHCTFINSRELRTCEMCNLPRN
uniref:Nuclear protein localization protein 4 homolog n=1 Tax=Corethrella appendiculata TaxID=1370023 RepID=U5EVM2_9DIPT